MRIRWTLGLKLTQDNKLSVCLIPKSWELHRRILKLGADIRYMRFLLFFVLNFLCRIGLWTMLMQQQEIIGLIIIDVETYCPLSDDFIVNTLVCQ